MCHGLVELGGVELGSIVEDFSLPPNSNVPVTSGHLRHFTTNMSATMMTIDLPALRISDPLSSNDSHLQMFPSLSLPSGASQMMRGCLEE